MFLLYEYEMISYLCF